MADKKFTIVDPTGKTHNIMSCSLIGAVWQYEFSCSHNKTPIRFGEEHIIRYKSPSGSPMEYGAVFKTNSRGKAITTILYYRILKDGSRGKVKIHAPTLPSWV